MNKKTTIIFLTAFSMLWGPVFLMGGLFNLAGHLLLAFSWLCLMEPRMAAREWNTLTEKIKRLWKKE